MENLNISGTEKSLPPNGYIIDFTNFVPEEREETSQLLVVDDGMSPFPEYLFIFKDKKILLTEQEFEAMLKLLNKKHEYENLREDVNNNPRVETREDFKKRVEEEKYDEWENEQNAQKQEILEQTYCDKCGLIHDECVCIS